MVEAPVDPGIRDYTREQLLESEIANLKSAFMNATPFVQTVIPEDSEVGGLVEGGTMTLTQSHDGKPVPKERVTIYATSNGEPREVLFYMLSKYLQRRHPDNTPVFSLVPTKPYITGNVKCYFHPDHPLRETMDRIGLAGGEPCPAGNLASEFHARRHAEIKHDQRWRVYREYLQQVEKDAEAKRWEVLLSRVSGQPEQAGGARAASLSGGAASASPAVVCEACGWEGKNAQALRLHKSRWCKGGSDAEGR